MKVNIIPDIHGSNKWKELTMTTSDLCIFLGDYCDSFTESNEQIINNLLDIIQFKKDNIDKVVLLWGNHEFQYLYPYDNEYSCSGLRPEIQFILHDILRENKSLFVNAYDINTLVDDVIVKSFLFTHAGIQDHWFKNVFKGNVKDSIAYQLNNPENREQEKALHDVGYIRGGNKTIGGIFWCDQNELKKPLRGYTQIVGHTPRKSVFVYKTLYSSVYFCDCLEYLIEPIILDAS